MNSDGYRDRLNQERASVLANLGIRHDALSQGGRIADEDQAPVIHEEFVSMRINLIEYQKLKLLNEALERLAGGDYGICEQCGGKIPVRRLEAVPWAKYCVRCQDKHTEPDSEPEWQPISAHSY